MVARRDCVIDLKVTSADYPEDETRHSGVGDYGTFTFHSSGGRGQVHLSAHREATGYPGSASQLAICRCRGDSEWRSCRKDDYFRRLGA